MIIPMRVNDTVNTLAAARPRHLQVTARVLMHECDDLLLGGQFHRAWRKGFTQCLMDSDRGAAVRQASNPPQLLVGRQIIGRNSRLQQLVAQCGIPPPRLNVTGSQFSDLTDCYGCDFKVMVIEPATILIKRCVIRNSDIGASGSEPCRQQPQVMAQLSGKRWRGIVVRPMCQRQVMLGIEKIYFFHLNAEITIR